MAKRTRTLSILRRSDFILQHERLKASAVLYDPPAASTPEDEIIAREECQIIDLALHRRLTEREERVIRLRNGLGCEEQSLDQVGALFGVTKERIRQIEQKAYRKLRHPRSKLVDLGDKYGPHAQAYCHVYRTPEEVEEEREKARLAHEQERRKRDDAFGAEQARLRGLRELRERQDLHDMLEHSARQHVYQQGLADRLRQQAEALRAHQTRVAMKAQIHQRRRELEAYLSDPAAKMRLEAFKAWAYSLCGTSYSGFVLPLAPWVKR